MSNSQPTKWEIYNTLWSARCNHIRQGRELSYANSTYENGFFTGRDPHGEVLFALECTTPFQQAV